MRITGYYLSLIKDFSMKDPIYKLIVPSSEELISSGVYDTSGEKSNTKIPGLQHKYRETALLLLTNRCAAYCRFCFRKRLVGLETKEVLQRFNKALSYIKKHREINNVLISGGDPFVLKTKVLDHILGELSQIRHLDFIRFGTRTPVVLPSRILGDSSLVKTLKRHSRKDKRIYIVTHFNHPSEITGKSTAAVNRILNAGIIVSNQTVLMKGVNDNHRTLAALMNRLVGIGVNPYYIFQCRPVKRVKSHFQVPFRRGIPIIENARKLLNGHSKRFKFVLSHVTGKIEIIGIKNRKIIFKYHQAKDRRNLGRIFTRKLDRKICWP